MDERNIYCYLKIVTTMEQGVNVNYIHVVVGAATAAAGFLFQL